VQHAEYFAAAASGHGEARGHSESPAHDATTIAESCAPDACAFLRIKLADARTWVPGSYCFLNFPGLAPNEWHPFSVSCAPNANGVATFHIKATNLNNPAAFTTRLTAALTGPYCPNCPNSSDPTDLEKALAGQSLRRVRVEGPYGSLTVGRRSADLAHRPALFSKVDPLALPHALLVCGGVGKRLRLWACLWFAVFAGGTDVALPPALLSVFYMPNC
jgi:hypothetical protein